MYLHLALHTPVLIYIYINILLIFEYYFYITDEHMLKGVYCRNSAEHLGHVIPNLQAQSLSKLSTTTNVNIWNYLQRQVFLVIVR